MSGALRVVVSPQSRADVAAIRRWYKKHLGSAAAAKAQATILDCLLTLTEISVPQTRPDLPDGVFRAVARRHIVLYSINGDVIRVLRVLHGAQDLTAAMGE